MSEDLNFARAELSKEQWEANNREKGIDDPPSSHYCANPVWVEAKAAQRNRSGIDKRLKNLKPHVGECHETVDEKSQLYCRSEEGQKRRGSEVLKTIPWLRRFHGAR